MSEAPTRARLSGHSLESHPLGPALAQILTAALAAVDARAAVRNWVSRTFAADTPLWVLGAGKAALSMAQGLLDARDPETVRGGLLVAKPTGRAMDHLGPLTVAYGSHPEPDPTSVHAAELLETAARNAPPDATVVGLISGGASALVTAPRPPASLEQIAELTRASLRNGVDIETLNTRRSALDRLKHGGLAQAVPASCPLHAAVVTDVIGAVPGAVGSGLLDVERCMVTEVLNNDVAVRAAADTARALGMQVDVREPMTGIARDEGIRFARQVLEQTPSETVRCTIAGGETRVIVRGDGHGGRNQELALAASPQLMGHPHALLATLATDGEDGPTDAAGAVVSGQTLARALELGLDPNAALRRNDAYRVFDALDDLLRPGPTHTNVCDLTVMLS